MLGLKLYLRDIKNLVSCPSGIYESLYLMTSNRLAEYCQTMASEELLHRQYQLAIATLKLRRGLFFPKNAGAETIAAEEAQWTYAIFSAALLKDFHQLKMNRETAERIIPPAAFRWISANKTLFSWWWSAILHEKTGQNDISDLIDTAAKKIGIQPAEPVEDVINHSQDTKRSNPFFDIKDIS